MRSNFKKLDINTKKLVDSVFLGNYKTAFKGRGLEFSGFRSYDSSDDSKRIDWLVSAKEGKTLVREFDEDREVNILFVLDLNEGMDFGITKKKIETLKELFFVLSYSGVQNGSRVGALLLGDNESKFIPYKKGENSLAIILKQIDSVFNRSIKEKSTYNDKLNLKKILDFKIKNALIFVLTDKTSYEEKVMKICSLKNDLVFINIFDNFENTLNADKSIVGLGNKLSKLFIDLSDKERVAEYKKLRSNRINKLKKDIQKMSADYLYIDDKSNIYKELLLLMQRRYI